MGVDGQTVAVDRSWRVARRAVEQRPVQGDREGRACEIVVDAKLAELHQGQRVARVQLRAVIVHGGRDEPGRRQWPVVRRHLFAAAAHHHAQLARLRQAVLVGVGQDAIVQREALAELGLLQVVAPAGDGAEGRGVVARVGPVVVLAVHRDAATGCSAGWTPADGHPRFTTPALTA